MKANGAPTLHYYLDIEKLSSSIKEFVRNRQFLNGNLEESNIPYNSNLEMECAETDDSLTETSTDTTSETTTNNSLVAEAGSDFEGEVVNIIDWMPDELEFQFPANLSPESVKPEHSYLLKTMTLPQDFVPSLEKQFRAAVDFPKKSAAYVTKKFVRHYQGKDIAMTLFDWNEKWWDWMLVEKPHYDYDAVTLKAEQSEIKLKIGNLIFTELSEKALLNSSQLVENLFGYFSETTISEGLDFVEKKYGVITSVSGNFFNLKQYNESPDWKDAVDAKLRELGLRYA